MVDLRLLMGRGGDVVRDDLSIELDVKLEWIRQSLLDGR